MRAVVVAGVCGLAMVRGHRPPFVLIVVRPALLTAAAWALLAGHVRGTAVWAGLIEHHASASATPRTR
ncbi:hypothetical protein ABT160_24515 [Streptomyces sp. NPDC001941]|uniref:hypothetical protein n=1 Tax=Streptomyces sp. NPDC001941 TaxID=3154659 RepID=UPI0033211B29